MLSYHNESEGILQVPPAIRRVHLPINGHIIGADVHLQEDSNQTPVVFFHGVLSSTSIASELFVDPSAESWISFSLPGHFPGTWRFPEGQPALNPSQIGFLYEEALGELIGSQPVITAGWSTGGFMAINHAICYPERVRAIASLAGFSCGRQVADMMRWLIWLSGVPLGSMVMKRGIQLSAAWPRLYYLMLGFFTADQKAATRIPHATSSTMYQEFRKHDADALTWFLAALPTLDITDHLSAITVPTWIAAGESDPVVPYAEAVGLSKAIAGSQLQTYPNAGHLFFSEWTTVQTDFEQWRRTF